MEKGSDIYFHIIWLSNIVEEVLLKMWLHMYIQRPKLNCSSIGMLLPLRKPLITVLKKKYQSCKRSNIFEEKGDWGKRCHYIKHYCNFLCWFSFLLNAEMFGLFAFLFSKVNVDAHERCQINNLRKLRACHQENRLSVEEVLKVSLLLCLPLYTSSDPWSPQLSGFMVH